MQLVIWLLSVFISTHGQYEGKCINWVVMISLQSLFLHSNNKKSDFVQMARKWGSWVLSSTGLYLKTAGACSIKSSRSMQHLKDAKKGKANHVQIRSPCFFTLILLLLLLRLLETIELTPDVDEIILLALNKLLSKNVDLHQL